jgi:aryl-alcohol dehydrogenase-like predicted oxidoreductase
MEELIEWVRTYPGQTGKSLVIAKATELLQKEQSRMYSEEDLREAFRQGMDNMDYSKMYGWSSELTEQEWFDQYKKK